MYFQPSAARFCDRLVLINKGRTMLYGSLDEIRRRYATQAVMVHATQAIPDGLPGIQKIEQENSGYRLVLKDGVTSHQLLKTLVERDIHLESFEIAMPTLDEIFIQVVQGEGAEA